MSSTSASTISDETRRTAPGELQRIVSARGSESDAVSALDSVGDRREVAERRASTNPRARRCDRARCRSRHAGTGWCGRSCRTRSVRTSRSARPHSGRRRDPRTVDDRPRELAAGRCTERAGQVAVPEVEVGAADAAGSGDPHPAGWSGSRSPEAMFALGFTNYWDTYFAGRAAPLGLVPGGGGGRALLQLRSR